MPAWTVSLMNITAMILAGPCLSDLTKCRGRMRDVATEEAPAVNRIGNSYRKRIIALNEIKKHIQESLSARRLVWICAVLTWP